MKDIVVKSNKRSKNIVFNISLSFVFKVIGLGLSYIVIPLTVNNLSSEEYGIWITLLSMISWMGFIDLGLGNGLRNMLTESLAKNKIRNAREYISTAYATISIISVLVFILMIFIVPNLNWNIIFNTQNINNNTLKMLVIIVLFFFLLSFILSLCNQLFYASQEAALTGLSALFLNSLLIIFIVILKINDKCNLVTLAIAYGFSLIMSNIISTVYFFIRHKDLLPSIKLIDFKKIKDILGFGAKFFVIQIAVIIIFSTDNMIISQVLGPQEVKSYNIVFKLFSVITLVHTMVLAPLWSAYTEAYNKGDLQWIKKTLKIMNLLMIPIILCLIIISLCSNFIIKIWMGNDIQCSKLLVIFMALYTLISVWNNIYAYFLNGIGKLNLSLFTAVLAALINIPASIIFSKYMNMGNAGVILGSICSLLIGAITGPIQTYYILNKKEGEKFNRIFN